MSPLDRLWREGWLRAVDRALADSLRRMRPGTPEPALVAIALCSLALSQGHSRLPLDQAAQLLADMANGRELPTLPDAEAMLAALQASAWTDEDGVVVLEGGALSLRRYWRHETSIASAVRARMQHATGTQAPRLLLLTGGPGTGKTTRVAGLIAEAVAAAEPGSPPRIALAAPTGKAASRLSEAVRVQLAALAASGEPGAATAQALGLAATTLHRLLGWQPGGYRHHADHPLPFDLVVVDEASMVDLPMMARLFEAVAPAANLVLVGDRDQLPSVDTGDALAALCDAITAPPVRLHLDTVHRVSAGSDLGMLAELVRRGEADAAMAGLSARRYRGVRWSGADDASLSQALQARALPAFRALQQAPDVATALALSRRFRVLTAVREGPAGSIAINAKLAAMLDPARRGEGLFRGKLLLVTENSYRQGLYNGDIGIAWPGAEGGWRVWFDSAEGPRAWLPAALPTHEPAYALTVHKAQGSEFDAVLLILPEGGGRGLSRELFYTGLTRCRDEITICASETALREALSRRSRRWSGLAGKLV